MKSYFLLVFLFLFSAKMYATHNRAGEITYKHISGLSYEVTITTYTDIGSGITADRDELELNWGDGTMDILRRINGQNNQGEILGNDIKRNIYKGTHTFNGPGTYKLSMEDPNRNEGIINIPGSVNLPFYIESVLLISPFGVGNYNSSPSLLNPPIDNACVGKLYVHNPGAFDPDGDSLSYKLITSLGEGGAEIAGYSIPPNVSINAISGDLIWNTPSMQGEFNFAILIEEWRKFGNTHVKIGSVLRDMQVTVLPCINQDPPSIVVTEDTCVVAKSFLSILVKASDPNNDRVTLTGVGGPLQLLNAPAQFSPKTALGNVSSTFTWNTKCSHVRLQPYSVLFRAVDDGFPSLSAYKTLNIKVIGPPVLNPQASPMGNSINLNWDKNVCDEVIAYVIYRKKGSYGFVPAYCETGVPSYTGFEKVGSVDGLDNTFFNDNNKGLGLVTGVEYCYMILSIFPDGSESLASEEVCSELKKDVAVITNISVDTTDTGNGKVYLAWSKPTELDLLQHPGPYKYFIQHSRDSLGTTFSLVDSTSQIIGLNDTLYTHERINTKDFSHSYRIDLYSVDANNRYLIGSSHFAPSLYLSVAAVSTGKALILNWNNNMPWANTSFTIFKFNDFTLEYDSIGTTLNTTYLDATLENGKEYCYKIRSVGSYFNDGFINPIVNYSQVNCGMPEDKSPPCLPLLTVVPDCDKFENELRWSNPNTTCTDKDAVKYKVYYKKFLKDAFELYKTIDNVSDTFFVFQNPKSIAGCFYVSAIDIYNNESLLLDSVCVDNCPIYELPNVYSPDGDDINDLFRPILPYRYVESIDISIYNRWGNQVFQTTDPDINWTGVNQNSNKISPEGVYFYVCKVNEIRLSGIESRTLRGWIHLFRNNDKIPTIPPIK